MGLVADKAHLPMATGERLHTRFGLKCYWRAVPLLYVRPDFRICGRSTETKRIAAVAEAHYVGAAPRKSLGPVNTVACPQIAARIPNLLQEYTPGEDIPPKSDIVKNCLQRGGGDLRIPARPGIAIELAGILPCGSPTNQAISVNHCHDDGSVADM